MFWWDVLLLLILWDIYKRITHMKNLFLTYVYLKRSSNWNLLFEWSLNSFFFSNLFECMCESCVLCLFYKSNYKKKWPWGQRLTSNRDHECTRHIVLWWNTHVPNMVSLCQSKKMLWARGIHVKNPLNLT